jgi:hypothetical protein
MAINPTDALTALTNAQCAQLRDDLVALLVASGIAEPTVRNLRRRVRIGIDYMEDKKDEQAERNAVEIDNLARQAHDAVMRPIRERRAARQQTDYGPD